MPEHLPTVTVAHPWRKTLRTVLQAALALAVVLPVVAETVGLDSKVYPWVAAVLAAAAAFTRVMALPSVEAFLRRFVPWLASDDVEAGHVVAQVVPGEVAGSRDEVVAGRAAVLPTGTPVRQPVPAHQPATFEGDQP